MNMKYEFVEDDTRKLTSGMALHRICATRDIPAHGVKAGDLGGYIEKRSNLSEESDAWVCENARVFSDAQVCENA